MATRRKPGKKKPIRNKQEYIKSVMDLDTQFDDLNKKVDNIQEMVLQIIQHLNLENEEEAEDEVEDDKDDFFVIARKGNAGKKLLTYFAGTVRQPHWVSNKEDAVCFPNEDGAEGPIAFLRKFHPRLKKDNLYREPLRDSSDEEEEEEEPVGYIIEGNFADPPQYYRGRLTHSNQPVWTDEKHEAEHFGTQVKAKAVAEDLEQGQEASDLEVIPVY